jgi:hypothetical protein
MKSVPAELDRIADAILAYRPKHKTQQAKKRSRKARRSRLEKVVESRKNGE